MAFDDSWFKFYYHRILVSCSGWTDDEFGAFVKLLSYQFDKGFIPADEKELRRIISSYKKNWPLLKTKFIELEPGKLINPVMDDIRKERLAKKEVYKEIGKTGGRPKKKKPIGFENDNLNGNHIRDNISFLNSNSCIEKGGVGEKVNRESSIVSVETELNHHSQFTIDHSKDNLIKPDNQLILPSMLAIWMKYNPKDFVVMEDAYEELREISQNICKWKNLTGDFVIDENANVVKHVWEELVSWLPGDDFLKNYSLTQVNKHLPAVIKNFNNRNDGSKIKPAGNSTATSRSVEALLSGVDE